jgi:small GTP-binding protein
MIGSLSVGKTSIITRLADRTFDIFQPSTVAAGFILHVETIGAQHVAMQIWDTAGQERFRSLAPLIYRKAAAGILVFDLTDRESFRELEIWTQQFSNVAGKVPYICIVGNKSDLTSDNTVTDAEATEWADQRQFVYCRTSAKTGEGITELFHTIAEEFARRQVNGCFNVSIHSSSRVRQCC